MPSIVNRDNHFKRVVELKGEITYHIYVTATLKKKLTSVWLSVRDDFNLLLDFDWNLDKVLLETIFDIVFEAIEYQ